MEETGMMQKETWIRDREDYFLGPNWELKKKNHYANRYEKPNRRIGKRLRKTKIASKKMIKENLKGSLVSE